MPSENTPNMLTEDNDENVHNIQKQRKEYQDCLSCRLIGTATCWGLGTYTIYHSYVHNPKLSRGSRFGLAFVGLGCFQVGLYRLLR